MTHYFFADPHFWHEKLILCKARPFSTPKAWVDYMVDKVNSRVKKQDILWFLGDFGFGDPAPIRKRIVCKNQRLIIGNHDSPKVINSFGKLAWHQRTIKVKDAGVKLFLSHYPTLYWNKSHRGSIHIYGHTHSQREDTMDALFPERRSIDASPENHFRLFGTWDIFSLDDILLYLKDRKGHDDPEFYSQFQAENFPKRQLVV